MRSSERAVSLVGVLLVSCALAGVAGTRERIPDPRLGMPVDEARQAAMQAPPVWTSTPPCAKRSVEPPPTGGFGVWLTCPGAGSAAARFVPRQGVAAWTTSGSVAAALRLALVALEQPLSPVENDGGYTSTLAGISGLVDRVSVDAAGTATVDFTSELARVPLAWAPGVDFLEQVNRTTFSFPAVQRLVLTLGGDCLAFWASFGTEWDQQCHVQTRASLQDARGTDPP